MKISLVLASTLIFSILAVPQPLPNVGNSCFINSALQCIIGMTDISQAIKDTNTFYKPESLSNQATDLIKNLTENTFSLPTITSFCHKTWEILKSRPGTQEDSDEFLIQLLEHAADVDIIDLVKQDYQFTAFNHQDKISPLYKSQIRQVLLDKAGTTSETIQTVSSFDIAVTPKLHSIEEGLEEFFSPAQLDDERIQTFRLEKSSKYIFIRLKRYAFVNGTSQRIAHPLSFPLAELNLSSYFTQPLLEKEQYNLMGVIMHQGTSAAGHYTAYIQDKNQWYYCNDSIIQNISKQQIASICQNGFGETRNTIPTFLIYERTESTPEKQIENQQQPIEIKPAPKKMTPKKPVPTKSKHTKAKPKIVPTKKTAVKTPAKTIPVKKGPQKQRTAANKKKTVPAAKPKPSTANHRKS